MNKCLFISRSDHTNFTRENQQQGQLKNTCLATTSTWACYCPTWWQLHGGKRTSSPQPSLLLLWSCNFVSNLGILIVCSFLRLMFISPPCSWDLNFRVSSYSVFSVCFFKILSHKLINEKHNNTLYYVDNNLWWLGHSVSFILQ